MELNNEIIKNKITKLNQHKQQQQNFTNKQLFMIAFLFRVLLVLYARIHDYLFELNFTDIDYTIFSDAANLVFQGKSPYERRTYRYSPLVAWLLIPNKFFADFGKILFCAVDVLVGWLQFYILHNETPFLSKRQVQLIVACLWLFNPFNAIIASRGNCDSLICFLVLLTLFFLLKSNPTNNYAIYAALIHGAGATHLRIYPVIYFPSIFLFILKTTQGKGHNVRSLFINKLGFLFITLSISSFLMLIAVFYCLYGQTFLDEFLFYHLARVDVKHNFSPYFYPLYLTIDSPVFADLLGKVAFIPQIICILIFAFRFYHDLPFCWFLTTFAFVSLNKVCTSQYFVWYLCLLPLIYKRIQMDSRKQLFLVILWFAGQGIWLFPAYLYEYQGINTIICIWLASLVFLIINLFIMDQLIKTYLPLCSDSDANLKKNW